MLLSSITALRFKLSSAPRKNVSPRGFRYDSQKLSAENVIIHTTNTTSTQLTTPYLIHLNWNAVSHSRHQPYEWKAATKIITYWSIVCAICIIPASKGRPTDISPLETLGHGVKSGGALWGNGCPSDDVKCCLVRFDGMVNTDFHAIKLPTSPLQLALQITMLACFLTEQQILYNTPRKINILNPTMQVFGSDEIPAISVAPPHLPSLQSCCLTNWPNCLSLPTRKDGACEPWNGIFWDLDRENYGLFKNLSVPK